MSDDIKKVAIIRSDESDTCPFGLDIPHSCNNAGNLVIRMGILSNDMDSEDISDMKKANRHLLRWKCPKERCIYAGKLFKNKDVVECNLGANDEGSIQRGAIVGSPFYYKMYSGIGLDGLYSYPLGYYADNSIDRGMYYGMYSLESTGDFDENIKKESNESKE